MRKFILFILLTITTHTLMAQSMEWICRPGKFSDINIKLLPDMLLIIYARIQIIPTKLE